MVALSYWPLSSDHHKHKRRRDDGDEGAATHGDGAQIPGFDWTTTWSLETPMYLNVDAHSGAEVIHLHGDADIEDDTLDFHGRATFDDWHSQPSFFELCGGVQMAQCINQAGKG